jgi:hypothetical protein
MASALDAFDFSAEEAEEALKYVENKIHVKERLVCICGHAVGGHSVTAGISMCSANKQTCPCKKNRAVIEVESARGFLRKTMGAGALHALSQGIVTAEKAGQKIEWIVDLKCDRCNGDGPLSPAPVNQRGNIMDYATGFDVLLCRKCREEV